MVLWIPELATNTAALTQQIRPSSLCTLGYANLKAGAKMPVNYCFWGVTKNLQAMAGFKPAPDPVTFGHLLSEVSIHNPCTWKHLPFISHCLTSTEWKGAEIMHSWTEFESNYIIKVKGMTFKCGMDLFSCKDINRRYSYQQGLLEKAQER